MALDAAAGTGVGGSGFIPGEQLPSYSTRPGTWGVEIATDIGGRPRQEDKYYARPSIPLSDQAGAPAEAGFFGVWDGTVCPHASEYVHTRCCDHHLQTAGFAAYVRKLQEGERRPEELARPLAQCCLEGYAATDADLLESCRQLSNHYSSCTSVTCVVASGILTVAHLGDSRAYLIVKSPAPPGSGSDAPVLRGVNLTRDHKPNDPGERERIEASGGTIEYLHHHHNKAFIRGGDFDRRKAAGERAMQLQYSRAFGGKDLKPFGLSAEPTITQFSITRDHVGLIICSDGISDVANADDAAFIVGSAWQRGEDAAHVIAQWAIQERAHRGMGHDNVTAIVCRFDHPSPPPGAAAAAGGGRDAGR